MSQPKLTASASAPGPSRLRSWVASTPSPSRHRRRITAAIAVGSVAIVIAAGCGAGNTATPAAKANPAGNANTPNAGGNAGAGAESAPAGGGEANTGEAPSVPFQSPKFRYRVAAPGAMTEAADGTATSHFGAESLSISVVTGSAAADPAALAKSDMDKVASSATNFKLKSAPSTSPLTASKSSIKAVYSATDGTNAVTGKANNVVVVKYWIPKDASNVAVFTYTITDTQYDPQGATDVANTFGWL